MRRSYSASPMGASGGGQHQFANFNPGTTTALSVAEAFRHSVNLVFVRLMRDIVRYYGRSPAVRARPARRPAAPARTGYLERFADREGRAFLSQFYDECGGQPKARWRSW